MPGFLVHHHFQVFSDSCPLSWWWHPTISSSVTPLLLLPSIFPSITVKPTGQWVLPFGKPWLSLIECKFQLDSTFWFTVVFSIYNDSWYVRGHPKVKIIPIWGLLRGLNEIIYESESRSVVSNSLRPHGLKSPWNSPGQNTGVSSRSLLQGIFPTQGSN